MASQTSHTMRSVMRLAMFAVIGYLVWSVGPPLFAAARFRMDFYQVVTDGAISGNSTQQLREDIQFRADELKVPLPAENVDVSFDPHAMKVTASYTYSQPMACFGQKFNVEFNGRTWAQTTGNLSRDRNPTGN